MVRRGRNLDNWQEEFKRKLVTKEEASGKVKRGDRLFIPNGYYGEMSKAILDRHEELREVLVDYCASPSDPGLLSAERQQSFTPLIRIYLSEARTGHDEGRIPFVPYTNGTWVKLYRDARPQAPPIDVLIMEMSPLIATDFSPLGDR
jgi:hypothetical protein